MTGPSFRFLRRDEKAADCAKGDRPLVSRLLARDRSRRRLSRQEAIAPGFCPLAGPSWSLTTKATDADWRQLTRRSSAANSLPPIPDQIFWSSRCVEPVEFDLVTLRKRLRQHEEIRPQLGVSTPPVDS